MIGFRDIVKEGGGKSEYNYINSPYKIINSYVIFVSWQRAGRVMQQTTRVSFGSFALASISSIITGFPSIAVLINRKMRSIAGRRNKSRTESPLH